MADNTRTLALFFGLEKDGKPPEALARAVADATRKAVQSAATHMTEVKALVTGGIRNPQWAATAAQVIAELRKSLGDISMPMLLVRGWNTYEPFRVYCNATDYPPDRSYTVPLYDHTLTCSYGPFVEILAGTVPLGKVSFGVDVEVTFATACLVIQAGKFMALETGDVSARGSLRCEGAKVLDRPLGRLGLPGHISFGNGFAIDPFGPTERPVRTS